MIRVPLGQGAYQRTYAEIPEIRLANRFFEQNPTAEEGASLLSRPGSTTYVLGGSDPYRAFFSKEGVFDGDLFIFATQSIGSDGYVGRHAFASGSVQEIDNAADVLGDISVAAAAGLFYELLFVASAGALKYYEGESYSRGYVRLTTDALSAQVVRVGNVYYAWRGAGTVDAGSPDGTSANPYLIEHGSPSGVTDPLNEDGLLALAKAINASGTPGTDYSSALTSRNPLARAVEEPYEFDTGAGFRWRLDLVARDRGSAGDSIVLETISGNIGVGNASAFGSPTTFDGGGLQELVEVTLPEGVEISKVAALSGFIIAVERDSNRFFFLYPGETEIDTLDYESAESEPDEIIDAVTVGDFVWLLGRSSVEAWYAAGDAERPIQRLSGSAFRIGAQPGTAVAVQSTLIFAGSDNIVYAVEGAPRRISDHGIEERLRRSGLLEKRAWTFALDGHYFYVLTIEDEGTFVYDVTTQQWAEWYTLAESPYWNLVTGIQWGPRSIGISWGQDTFRLVDPDSNDPGSVSIPRIASGVLAVRQRDGKRCSLARLYASVGNPDAEQITLNLRFSDDGGNSWSATYSVILTDDASQRLDFPSLGLLGVPGRVWEVSDTGGLVRLDGLYVQID